MMNQFKINHVQAIPQTMNGQKVYPGGQVPGMWTCMTTKRSENWSEFTQITT